MPIRSLIICLTLCVIVTTRISGADTCRTVHVFVALADNDHQGIIPVPAKLGDGEDPYNNLYWGAAYGLKTFFNRSSQWSMVSVAQHVRPDTVLEQCVFRHTTLPLCVIAHAYKGERIKQAVSDFFACVAGRKTPDISRAEDSSLVESGAFNPPDLVAYVGHDGLMDFNLPIDSLSADSTGRQVIILACVSKQFFGRHIRALRADPVLWTTGLMAPEAYTLEAAIVAWADGKDRRVIRDEAARAYDRYQHCGFEAAKRLLVTEQ
ncbi:MAG: hypothetical protein AB1483_02130 [Candidatus Zixiibacteriota bacterium]